MRGTGAGARSRPGPDGEPSVFAADEQSAVPVAVEPLARLAELVLAAEGVRGASELTLYFVDEEAMTDLNGRFLGGEGPTDVLAFPLDAGDPVEGGRSPDAGSTGPDRRPVEAAEVPLLLGDVVVCPAVAERNAVGRDVGYESELALLVVHGVLHVLGMDHADEAEAATMQSRERELLDRFSPFPA